MRYHERIHWQGLRQSSRLLVLLASVDLGRIISPSFCCPWCMLSPWMGAACAVRGSVIAEPWFEVWMPQHFNQLKVKPCLIQSH